MRVGAGGEGWQLGVQGVGGGGCVAPTSLP